MASPKGQFQVDFLRSVIANGGRIEKARFSLQRGPLKFIEPIYSLTLDQHGVRSLQELSWTPEVERYMLFDAPRQVDDLGEEAERFAAILLNNLETAAAQYGKDYSQAVLVAMLRARPQYDLKGLIDRAATPRPSNGSRHYADCTAFITHSIDGLQETAIRALKHPPAQALSLMNEALRIVLDETFHISAADMLFPKHR